MTTGNGWRCVAGLLGLSGVMIGAVAAHAVADPLAAAAVERGSLYQLLHAAALLALAPLGGWPAWLAKLGLATGVVLFSGSIAIKHLAGLAALGWLAPVGGVCLMAGWALVVLAAILSRRPSPGA